jgi:hypothetical protein
MMAEMCQESSKECVRNPQKNVSGILKKECVRNYFKNGRLPVAILEIGFPYGFQKNVSGMSLIPQEGSKFHQ